MKELILSILEIYIQIFAPKENAKVRFYFVINKISLKIRDLNKTIKRCVISDFRSKSYK